MALHVGQGLNGIGCMRCMEICGWAAGRGRGGGAGQWPSVAGPRPLGTWEGRMGGRFAVLGCADFNLRKHVSRA
eukprot:5940695-Prymnesium_polylepis.2